jgi:sulfur relay (sulfurtransferase) complex TusBCD TusD component (DsrE family)
METAKTVDRPECWERLAQQALKQGNHKVGVFLIRDLGGVNGV